VIRIFVAVLLLGLFSISHQARAIQTGITGGGMPVNNMQPSLAMRYIIRLQGDFDRLGGSRTVRREFRARRLGVL
jgi:hypothetical protein